MKHFALARLFDEMATRLEVKNGVMLVLAAVLALTLGVAAALVGGAGGGYLASVWLTRL